MISQSEALFTCHSWSRHLLFLVTAFAECLHRYLFTAFGFPGYGTCRLSLGMPIHVACFHIVYLDTCSQHLLFLVTASEECLLSHLVAHGIYLFWLWLFQNVYLGYLFTAFAFLLRNTHKKNILTGKQSNSSGTMLRKRNVPTDSKVVCHCQNLRG